MMFDYVNTIPARGSAHTFPVHLAPDGTPCMVGPAVRAVDSDKKELVFYDRPAPEPYPVDKVTALYPVCPGDFIGVYTRTSNGLTLQSFRIESVHPDNLTAILADTLLIVMAN